MPQFSQCGGCVFRHIQYEAELRIKEQRVRDAISRIGGIEGLTIHPILGAPQVDHYRNKAQFPIGRARDGGLLLGFYAHHSHRIVACDTCALQPAVFYQAVQVFRQWEQEYPQEVYDESTGKGRLRHFYLRYAQATGEMMVCVVVMVGLWKIGGLASSVQVPEVKSVCHQQQPRENQCDFKAKNAALSGGLIPLPTFSAACGSEFRPIFLSSQPGTSGTSLSVGWKVC